MSPSSCVGRIGALAVALGIGSAITIGSPAVAWARPADSPAAPQGTESSGGTGAPAAENARPTTRGNPAPRRAASRATTAVQVEKAADVEEAARPSQPARNDSPAGAVADNAPPSGIASTTAMLAGDATLPEPVRDRGSRTPSPVTDGAVSAAPAAATFMTAPLAIGPVQPALIVAPIAVAAIPVAPQMLQAPTRPAPAAAGALASLLGSAAGGPVESPVSWVMLAATTRTLGRSLPTLTMPAPSRAAVKAAAAPVNQPPAVTNVVVGRPNPTTGAVSGTVTAADPNSDRLAYTAATTTKGQVSITSAGVFTYTPAPIARHQAARIGAGPMLTKDTVTVTVVDPYGGKTSVAVSVPISPANRAPTASAGVGSTNAATGMVTGKVTGSDADRDALSYLGSTTTAKGTVVVGPTGAYTYTPTLAAAHRASANAATAVDRTDNFVVTVSDGYGGVKAVPVSVTIKPRNTAPTARSTMGNPDATGTVAGVIVGSDADNDPLSYRVSAATPKGVLVVDAAGGFTYTPTSAARQAAGYIGATAADRTDTFSVTIVDGHGATVTVPVSVVVGSAANSGTGLSSFCGCTLMPADTVFHADVRNLPVLAKSGTWLSVLGADEGATLRATWGGQPWLGSVGGMPVNIVGASHRTERVIFNRGLSTSGPSIDDRPYAIPDYPIVEGMGSAGAGTVPAWDRHLLVFQEGTCVSQELYNVANGVELPANGVGDALANGIYASQYGSAWIAEAGVRYDMSDPRYPAIGAANAARLPYLPLILRPDDLERGHIDHMLGITIAKDRGTGYTWPARAGDGAGTNPDGVPMGTVLRLRADFDITGYSPPTQVILRALQEHGAVIYDSGNRGEPGARVLGMSNGWTGTDHITAQRELERVPLNSFEAVDVMSLALDPAVGWMIRSSLV